MGPQLGGRPDGKNATQIGGIHKVDRGSACAFSQEVIGKRLRLLHDLVSKAVRFAVLVNPENASSAQTTLQGVREAASIMGLQIQILNATTTGEIDAAFAALAREHLDALFVAPDAFFNSRGVQFATLTARERIPAAYSAREIVAAGGLMSYGADLADMSRQVGVYTGSILKGAKPSLIKAGLLSSCTSGWVNARLICLNADEVDSCGSWGWMPN